MLSDVTNRSAYSRSAATVLQQVVLLPLIVEALQQVVLLLLTSDNGINRHVVTQPCPVHDARTQFGQVRVPLLT